MAITKTEIDIILRARAELLGLKQARNELGGIQREIKESNAAMKSFAASGRNLLGTLGVGFSAGAIISGVKQVIDYGSKITDLATQTGTSTDAFQTLAIAAQDAGVQQDQLANVLVFLRKSISETAAGTGEAVQAFRGLKLEARELAGLPVERALEAVAKAVANAEDKTTAYGYALDILGARNAPRLQEVLNRLADEGFDKLNKEFEKFIINRKQLDQLDEAGDKLEKFYTRAKKLAANAAGPATELLDVRQDDTFLDLANPYKAVLEALPVVYQWITRSKETSKELGNATDDVADSAATVARHMAAVAASQEQAKVAAEAFAEAQKFATGYIAERQKMLDEENKRTLKLNEEAAKLGEDQRKFLEEQMPPLERHAVLQERINALKREALSLRGQDDNETFARRLKIEQAILETDKEIAQVNQEVSGVLDGYFLNIDKASKSTNLFEKELKTTKETADEMGWAFQSAFESAILEGKKLSDVLRGLAQDILKIVIRKSITEPIGNFISSGISSIFGRATGGPVAGGTAYLVGERGPELFVPNASGSIVPNDEMTAMASAGSGETFVFNQYFQGGVTRGEMADIIPQIIEASKGAIADARRRRQPGFA